MVSCVILAGGLGSRMGGTRAAPVDKARLVRDGRPLLDTLLERLGPQVDRIALNANGDPARWADTGLEVVPDTVPDRPGPLAGVLAGMDWAAAHGAPAVLSVAADCPAPPRDLAARLGAAGGLALAATGGRAEPTFGLWPVALRGDLRAALEGGTRKVTDWTGRHAAVLVDFPAGSFANVNRPEDL